MFTGRSVPLADQHERLDDALVGLARICFQFDLDALMQAHPVFELDLLDGLRRFPYPSLSFLHTAADQMAEQKRPCFIYQFGDHDPSLVDAAGAIEKDLRRMSPNAEIHFERVAVTRQQIADWNLPTRPTKKSDTRSKKWMGGDSVGLDALDPDTLRRLVRDSIERHVDREQLNVLIIGC
jgi:hypothetical protein